MVPPKIKERYEQVIKSLDDGIHFFDTQFNPLLGLPIPPNAGMPSLDLSFDPNLERLYLKHGEPGHDMVHYNPNLVVTAKV